MKRTQGRVSWQYRRVLELGLIVSLVIHIGIMQGYKRVRVSDSEASGYRPPVITVENIPPTAQEKTALVPKLPGVPIPDESEKLPDYVDWEDPGALIDIGSMEIPEPPEVTGIAFPVFTSFDEEPYPIGGLEAFRKNIVYPELARKAGVEGQVIVLTYIDRTGKVVKTEIQQGLMGCDQAAVDAILKTKWHPAMQRDEPVPVRISIPVAFRLK